MNPYPMITLSVFYLSFSTLLFNLFRFLCKLNMPTTVILSLCLPFLTIACNDPVWYHPVLEFLWAYWVLGISIGVILIMDYPRNSKQGRQ